MTYELTFETKLAVTPERAWSWITSFEGVSKEMAPYLHMSAPKGVTDLTSVPWKPGVPMFRSWITLFRILPIDRSLLTLLSLEPGLGFVEQSPMLSMKLWRHERTIIPDQSGCRIQDKLTFEPRFAGPLVFPFIRAFFTHRHRRLAKFMGLPA